MSDPARKLKFFGLALSGLVILVMVAGWFIVWRGSRDVAPPDVSDLVLGVVEVDDEDNARIYVEQAIAANRWNSSQIDLNEYLKSVRTGEPPEEPVDPDELRRVLEENRQLLDWMRRAAECDHFVSEANMTMESQWPIMDAYRVFTLLLAMAAHASEQGDHALAVEIQCMLSKVAVMIQKDASSLISTLVGQAWLIKVNQGTIHVMAKQEVSAADARRVMQLIPRTPQIRESLARGLKGEYFCLARSIDEWVASDRGRRMLTELHDLPDGLGFLQHSFFDYRFHPNRTKQLFVEGLRNALEWMPLPYRQAEAVHDRIMVDDGQRWSDLFKPNSLGNRLYGDFASAMGPQRQCRVEFEIEAARVALLLLIHRKEHGSFPLDLSTLKTDGLETIPADPFDGNPMRYDAAKAILYSVGKDGIDDSGEGDDRVFELDPRATKAKPKGRSRRAASE